MKNGWKRTRRIDSKWIIVILLVFISVGLLAGCSGKKNTTEELEELSIETTGAEETTLEQTVYVYVCGAVNVPGVYELKENARIYEALELAGGTTEEAAVDWINQAEPVTDGERIYVPTREETENASASGQWMESAGGESTSAGGKININTAGKEELMTLSGIGESKAQSILKYRQEHGAFQSIEELKQIEGIKDGVFNKIKEDITV